MDFYLGLPLVFATLWSVLIIVMEAATHKPEVTKWLTVFGFTTVIGISFSGSMEASYAFSEMIRTGLFSNFVITLFALSGLLVVLTSEQYASEKKINYGEFYIIVFIAVVGMMLMGTAANMAILFIGLEMMSLSLYVLAGMLRKDQRSNEAAMKYFLLGSFASAIFLYGIALIYGATGELMFHKILKSIVISSFAGDNMSLFWVGFTLLVVGFLFKVSAVPFHQWTPDVYEGTPTPSSAFMSTGAKSAAFVSLISIILHVAPLLNGNERWTKSIAIVSALTMIVGNFAALVQPNLKRMLAYSSIAHAGYLLAGIVAGTNDSFSGILFYLFIYTLMNIGAFGVVGVLESLGKEPTKDGFIGLSKEHPIFAAVMAVFMLSLAGIPPLAGFVGKYLIFSSLVETGNIWLAVVGVLTSAVSAYYYLKIIVAMYMMDSLSVSSNKIFYPNVAIVLVAVVLVVLGVFPSWAIQLTDAAVKLAVYN
ncbi:MAG: NADH-quinone oxidoreductase subunit N [Chloroherpetonaceae bacterium]|nr:NADH-quinone oxidoreductase subunit N [Chloroherpetonaceae bacterium]